VGQILLTSAYRFADASLIAPFEYASMLLAIIVGYVGVLRGAHAARC
jgi:drug/metabolite transporter (DMT)-like permease